MKWPVILLWASTSAFAQGPLAEAKLSIAGGQTQFHIGELIELRVEFPEIDQGVQIWRNSCGGELTATSLDRFTVTPDSGWRAPWTGRCTTVKPDRTSALPLYPEAATSTNRDASLDLNDFVVFQEPGSYRIRLTSARTVGAGPFPSNEVELSILARDPVADRERFEQAKALIDQALVALAKGDNAPDVAYQLRVLRCLQTEDAARYLASVYGRGLGYQEEGAVYLGLRMSLFRNLVLTELERHLADPGLAVTTEYVETLVEIAADLGRFGPGLRIPSKEAAHRKYYQTALLAAKRKIGEARPVTYFSIFGWAPRPLGYSEEARRGLLDSLPQAPAGVWSDVLGRWWDYVAYPGTEMIPALRGAMSKTWHGPKGPGIALAAAMRLAEVDPDWARRLLLQSLVAKGPQPDVPPVADYLLPDFHLQSPAIDDTLLRLYRAGYAVDARLARYASPIIAKQVLDLWDRNFDRAKSLPYPVCTSAIMAYFFRVDPAEASERLSRIRQLHQYGDYENFCGALTFEALDVRQYRGLASPGLERQLIEDLDSADRMNQIGAAQVLGAVGSAAAEQPLWAALQKLSNPSEEEQPVRVAVVLALLNGPGWLLKSSDYEQLENTCGLGPCPYQLKMYHGSFREPYRIRLLEPTGFWILNHAVRSLPELESQVSLFPKASAFQWVRSSTLPIDLIPVERRAREQVRALVLRRGMKWARDYKLPTN